MGVGKNAWLGFAIQSTYGTSEDVAANGKFIKNFLSESLKLEQNFYFREGRDGKTYKSAKGMVRVAGDVEMFFLRDGIELWLEALFGRRTETEIEAGVVYKHEFTFADNPKLLTVDINRDENIYRYEGLVCGSFVIEQALDDFLKLTTSLVGHNEELPTSYTPSSYVSEDVWSINELTTFTIGGASIEITMWRLEVNWNLQDDRYTNASNNILRPVPNSAIEITFRAEGYFLDKAYYEDIVRASGEAGVSISYTGDSIGTSSTQSLSIDLPAVRFRAETPGVGADGGYIPLALEGRAIYDETSGYALKISIVNTTTA